MRLRYQRRSVSILASGNVRNLDQRLSAQSLGLDGEPSALVVREPETLTGLPPSLEGVPVAQVTRVLLS